MQSSTKAPTKRFTNYALAVIESAVVPASGAALASAFSPAVLKALAREVIGSAAPRIRQVAALESRPGATLGEAFGTAHDLLVSGYRSEYVFTNQIISKVVFGRHSPRTASALTEVPMGRSVADLLILNGTTTTYEVKTDLDQFTRLATQLSDYAEHTEHVNVVVSDKRAAVAERQIEKSTGIIALRRNGALATIRPPSSNMSKMSVDSLFLMLRTAEAKLLLLDSCGYEPDVAPGHLWLQMRELFRELTIEDAHRLVLLQLKNRSSSAMQLVVDPVFPPSMRALAYGSELSKVGIKRVHARLASEATLFLGT